MRWLLFIGMVLVLLTVHGAVAVSETGVAMNDSCYTNTPTVRVEFEGAEGNSEVFTDLGVQNECVGSEVQWLGVVNLSVLGDIRDEEVVIGETFVYVDSVARPDLNEPARLVFQTVPFAVQPDVLRDGVECGDCVSTFNPDDGSLEVVVQGFSNYSLTGQQDFIVYSDAAPELKQKVYQTIDLGDANRGESFACVVQVFGQSAESPGQWVLVQTNPERAVQARLLGNPDSNQPESLGYFPTMNGLANTYFRNDNLYGYMDFELVIQCTSNSTKLVYEESMATVYSPAGRPVVSRGVWLTDGDNAFYLSVYVVFGFLVLWIGGSIWRRR